MNIEVQELGTTNRVTRRMGQDALAAMEQNDGDASSEIKEFIKHS